MTFPAVTICLNVLSATRAHSTSDNKFGEEPNRLGLEGDRTCRGTEGDVDCRFNGRGWRGEIGAELVRRNVCLVVAVLTNDGDGGGSSVAGVIVDEALAASDRAFSAALMTCVARVALSRLERPPAVSTGGFGAGVLPRREGARDTFEVAVLARDRAVAAREVVRDGGSSTAGVLLLLLLSSFGRSKLFNNADVAGVHVATEATALRTAAAAV